MMRTDQRVLTRRRLNRALLARQLLLQRIDMPVPAALEHLVGLQAQAPRPPYLGLWARLQTFRPERLADLIRDREALRIALMRSTIHLVTADDALTLRPVVQPVIDRALQPGAWAFGRRLPDEEAGELRAAARTLVEQGPRTPRELVALLRQRWPDDDAGALANAVRALLPLVQVPPRGLWGVGGVPAVTTAEAWLGRPLAVDASPDATILRYLRAFGPAGVADAQTWSGLTGLRAAFERLRPQLRVFLDERGVELFDVADGPLPEPDTPAPVRLLPEYDNLLLSHADRTRVISDEHRKRIASRNGQVPGAVLVDGFVRGIWRIARQRRTATLEITPFAPLSSAERAAIRDEGAALLAFAAGDADVTDVRVAAVA